MEINMNRKYCHLHSLHQVNYHLTGQRKPSHHELPVMISSKENQTMDLWKTVLASFSGWARPLNQVLFTVLIQTSKLASKSERFRGYRCWCPVRPIHAWLALVGHETNSLSIYPLFVFSFVPTEPRRLPRFLCDISPLCPPPSLHTRPAPKYLTMIAVWSSSFDPWRKITLFHDPWNVHETSLREKIFPWCVLQGNM